MDVVTDLTSQAVSYVCIILDICKEQPNIDRSNDKTVYFLETAKGIGSIREKCSHNQRQNISEITWISKHEIFLDESLDDFFETTIKIIEWYLKFHRETEEYLDSRSIGPLGLNSSPYQWRQGIRYILYRYPKERTTLVKKLHYMPLQIILCLGGGTLSAYEQRLFQVWEPDYNLNTTSEKDMAHSSTWWINEYKGQKRVDHAFQLLENDDELLEQLNHEDIPVPFESILHDELNEIEAIREVRLHRDQNGRESDFEKTVFGKHKNGRTGHHRPEDNDPLERAKSMHLYGLTFSGGGIRSATFNLGILQKLANQNLLKKFDYLSTVSGGGYIGSWFASWVQRTGSISSVNDRLNPEKSADPLGEDVRPIRWLRMFSNYLSPNASIMSSDAWTAGITWLRNTLINQVILLLLLCSALFGVQFVYHSWVLTTSLYPDEVSWLKVGLWSIPIFIPAALFAGFGMRAYSQDPPHSPFSREKNSQLASWLIGWGLVSAFGVSSWFFTSRTDPNATISGKAGELLPAAGIGFISLLIVAYIGQYGKCIIDRVKAWIYIIISSLLAALAGALLLACGWQILDSVKHVCADAEYRNKIGFMVALPLILEVMSIIVVIRMALLGNVFPDERREWWGRVGAIVHRFMFIWIVAVAAIFFLPGLGSLFTDKVLTSKVIAAFGGWAAIIGAAVKMAFNPKTSGDKPAKGSLSVTELFIRLAPYIFALGFLVIGAYVSRHIFTAIPVPKKTHTNDVTPRLREILLGFALCIAVGGITALLSWRIGVNEFSLHHFYRNRLVRAYLGATRRRKEREQTVNNFTNFDKLDDLKLACLVKAKGYCGPYMILNSALNATVITDELDRQDRKAESFVFTPKYCGFDCSRTRSASRSAKKSYDYGYRPTAQYSKIDGPELGTAMAVSGAAVNPNMGYHSSAATAFLLTIFNVRLGLWIGNPRKSAWKQSDPKFGLAYLLDDLVGKSDTTADFVCLSDGGHFDNMGIYELVRRKCKFILVCDAEEDDDASCEGFANAIRRCRVDFGAQIEIDIAPVIRDPVTKISKQHHVTGTIWYMGDPANSPSGVLTYVKTSLTGNESVDVREYLTENPQFPEQSTADQFFDESQFESYRKLGYSSL